MNQSSASILPDAGGPYGAVKPGVIEIATGTGATVTPLAVHCKGTVELGRQLQHELPWPGCTLKLQAGAPIPASEVNLARCKASLDELSSRASPT